MRLVQLMIITLCLLVSTAAHAVSISNLTDRPQTITINNAGEIRTVTIAPMRTYRTWGHWIRIRKEGQMEHIARGSLDEFAIWPSGKLALQRHRHRLGKGLD